jgi:AraC-like DNA-binding protein
MTARKTSLLVSSDILHLLRGYSARSLPPSAELLPDLIPVELLYRIWSQAAAQANDPFFGLHFGSAIPDLMAGHLLPAVMLNCPTTAAALERFCRFHGLMANAAPPALRHEAGRTHIIFEQAGIYDRGYFEAVLAMTCAFLRRVAGGYLRPERIHCTHSEPENSAEYGRVLGCPVEFDRPAQQIIYQTSLLEQPIPLADPALLAHLEEYACQKLDRLGTADSWSGRTGAMLQKMMLRGEKPDLGRVSAALAVGARTLQSHLRDEGSSYQAILDETRRGLAEDLLRRDDLSLCDAAFLLGFSEQSAFNHAFKRWTGLSPADFRAKKMGM